MNGRGAAYPLEDREGHRMAELVVAAPEGRELTLYEADFIEGLALAGCGRSGKRPQSQAQPGICPRAAGYGRGAGNSTLAAAAEVALIPGYSLAFRSDTCYEVGGDYLDIVEQPDGSLLMVVADVAGKGMASAMMSTSFRSAFRAMAAGGPPLDELGHAHEPAPLDGGRRGAEALCDGDLPAPLSRDGRAGGGERGPQSGVPGTAGRGAAPV